MDARHDFLRLVCSQTAQSLIDGLCEKHMIHLESQLSRKYHKQDRFKGSVHGQKQLLSYQGVEEKLRMNDFMLTATENKSWDHRAVVTIVASSRTTRRQPRGLGVGEPTRRQPH